MLFRSHQSLAVGSSLTEGDLPLRKRRKIVKSSVLLFAGILLLASYFVFIPVLRTHAQAAIIHPLLGINSGADIDLFTDAMKTARITWDNTGDGDVPLDANGWPTTDGGVYVWEGKDKNDGTYKLIFNGQADVDVTLSYGIVSNKQYDSATNTTTATLVITDSGAENFHLNFHNTRRTSNSNTNTGVTNVRLYKPTSEGSGTPYDPSVTFTTDYKNAVAPYNYIRFMGGTNWNTSTKWSDRTTVNSSTQHQVLPGEKPFEGNQIAFEYMVQFCNETNKDLYVLVPDRVDDDYVTKLAQLLLYGSDGTNPYTGPTQNPVYAPLKSNLNVYVEYSNEVWNFGFGQATDVYQNAKAEVQANPSSALNYDNINDENVWRFRSYARRSKEISALFRGVFGGDAMAARVRPLLFWQYNNLSFTAENELQFLNDYYNNADGVQHVTDPHPVSYYFWGGGGAVYYHSQNDNAGSVDGIYNAGFPETSNSSVDNVESYWANTYGLRFVAYEGGYAVGGDTPNDIQKQAKFDPRAKQTMIDSYNAFARSGGSAYTVGTYSQWQSAKTAGDSPLVQAAQQITSSGFNPDSIALGTPLAGNDATFISGPHYTIARTWPSGASTNLGKVTGYLLRADADGNYQVALSVGNSANGGKIDVYLDGTLLGTVAVPGTGNGAFQTVVAGSKQLAAGLHGLLLRPTANAGGGNAGTINAVVIQPGSGTPPTVPAPGALPSGWQSADVGPVGQAGSASYANDTFTVTASGYDITGNADAFHYVYQQVSGDGEIVARVVSVANSYEYEKPGVMIRETLDSGAKHASMFLFPSLLGAFNARTTTGGDTTQPDSPKIDIPYWVKVTRQGSNFVGYVSPNGNNWTQVGSVTIAMANTVDVGLALSPHDSNLLASADFDHVSLNGFTGVPVTPGPTPTATPGPGSTPTPTPNPGGSQTIDNAGFETPDVGSNTFGAFKYAPSGAGWTFSGGDGNGSGISGNNSGFTGGSPNAPEGKQVAFLQGQSTVSQSVNFSAGSYKVSFLATQRTSVNTGNQDVQVLIDDKVVGTFTPTGGDYGSYTTDSFTVTQGTHTLTFKSRNSQGGDNTLFIDNVTIGA